MTTQPAADEAMRRRADGLLKLIFPGEPCRCQDGYECFHCESIRHICAFAAEVRAEAAREMLEECKEVCAKVRETWKAIRLGTTRNDPEHERAAHQADGADECAHLIEQLTAESAGESVGDEWLPIESAPKDGSTILLTRAGKNEAGVELGIWWVASGFWSKRWRNWNDGVEPCGYANPSHWQPLPAPPLKAAEGGA